MVRRLSCSAVNAARAAAGLSPLVRVSRGCAYDPDSRLFVIAKSSGFGTLGLAYARETAATVRTWAGLPDAPSATPAEVWASYAEAMRLGSAHAERTGIRCLAHLTPGLVGLEGRRVAVHVPGEPVRRFTVGRSTGWCPVHLEIARRGCYGGVPATVSADARVEVIR